MSNKNRLYAQQDGVELFEPEPVHPMGYICVVSDNSL